MLFSLNAKWSESQQRLAILEARDKKLNKHSAQLEELRNLQEAFIKEKNQFNNERDLEMQELKRQRQDLDKDTVRILSLMRRMCLNCLPVSLVCFSGH